jgi:hypothetical protein
MGVVQFYAVVVPHTPNTACKLKTFVTVHIFDTEVETNGDISSKEQRTERGKN